jgi:cell division septation protein DedD
MTATAERRAVPRHAAQETHNVLMVRAGAAARTCRIANLSRTGCLLRPRPQDQTGASRIKDTLRISSEVVLRFTSAASGKYHSVLAKVQRIDGDGIALGFVEPLSEDTTKLYQFALGVGEQSEYVAATPWQDDAMQMDFDKSIPRLAVDPAAGDPADVRSGERVTEDDISERLTRVSTRGTTAVLVGLVVVAVLAAFLAIRNFQLSERLARVEARIVEMGAASAPQWNDRLSALESRTKELGESLTALQAGSGVAREGENAAAEDALAGLRNEIDAVKKEVAALASAPGSTAAKTKAVPASTASTAGSWVVQVVAVADRSEAGAIQARVERSGFDSEIDAATIKGKTYFRVIATGFTSQDQARAAATRLKRDLGLAEAPWVTTR